MDPFSNVYPTLLGCFGIILIGYVFGRLNWITESQGKGLGMYISRVALPALLFKSLVALDFSKVDWHFWFGILLSKTVMFIIVVLLTLFTTRNDLGKAGLFGIFVTQSNDLALGLPLFDAIFGEFHPEYCQYLYLLIPVSVAFLNPIGFLMLEFQKSANEQDKTKSNLAIVWKAVKGVITNPLVFMVILGLIFHFVLNYTKEYTGFDRNHWFLSPFLSVIGSSFGSTALFYLGLTLVGRTKEFDGFALLVPFLLVFCKSLIFPVLARQAVFWLCSNSSAVANETSLSSFAFLYGTLPTAPPVAVYATMYNTHIDTIGTSMVLGTFLSAPIMFVSSKMILVMKSNGSELENSFFKALFDTVILSAVCCIWVFVVMFTTKFYRKLLHQCTLCLVACQFLLALATSLSRAEGEHPSGVVISAVFFIGLFGSSIWTALVSVTLAMVRCKGEIYVSKRRWIFFAVGTCCPLVVGIPLALLTVGEPDKKYWLLEYMDNTSSFNYCFGIVQILTTVACVGSLIVLQRCDKYCRCNSRNRQSEAELLLPEGKKRERERKVYSSCKRCKTLCEKQRDIEDISKYESSTPSSSNNIQATPCSLLREEQQDDSIASGVRASSSHYNVVSPLEDMNECQFDELKDIENLTLREYFQGDSHQLTRHVILILFLCLFSILSMFLCFERVTKNSAAHNNGVYIEMEFLAVTCILGQGFVSFAVFGFNKVFFSLISFERLGCLQPWCFAKKIDVTPYGQLDEGIKMICQRFKAHHLEQCKADLVCDLRFFLKSYKNVFRGDQLVDWIIEFGLANTRMDAVYYGNCLLQGQIIQHCVNEHHFYDLPYFYRFCNVQSSTDQLV